MIDHYPAKPIPGGTDSTHAFGRALFFYLLTGVVDGRETFGLLTDDELSLALHSSTYALVNDASTFAHERIADVRLRIARTLRSREAEHIEPATLPSRPPKGATGTSAVALKPYPIVSPPAGNALMF